MEVESGNQKMALMKIIEIAFSGYPVTDLKRARQFYEGTLGLKQSMIFGDENEGWIEYDIGAGTLAITNFSSDWKPSADGGGVALEVEHFDSAIAELKGAGIKFRIDPMETPVCFMAIVFDPDGNAVCIHKRKEK
jgi:predicted enzyme related to lactoylglutathione lyase